MTSPNLLPSSTHNILWMQFKNCFRLNKGRTCKIHHDCVDFECFNRPNPENQWLEWRAHPFDPSHKSHKFKGPGLQCGITTCRQTGEIVSCHGPFPASEWHDLTICRRCVEPMLAPSEMVEADAGCRGDETTRQPKDDCCRSEKMAKKKAASRHEAANGRLDNFRCLRSQFRHNGHEHKHYFHTLVVVTQLMLRRHGQHPLSCQNKVIVFIRSDLQTCVVAATMFDEGSSDFTHTQSDWGWSDWTWSWTTQLTPTWPSIGLPLLFLLLFSLLLLLTVLDPLLLLLLLRVSPPSSYPPSTSMGSSKLPPWPQCKGMGRGTWTRSKGRSSRKSKSASMSWIILSGGRGVFIWGSTYNHPSSSMCPTTMLFHTSWVTLEQARILRASTSMHTPAIRESRLFWLVHIELWVSRVECQCCNAIVALKRHLMMHWSILKVIVSFLWASQKFCEPTRNCFSLRLSRSFTLFFQTMAIFRYLPEIVSGWISLIFDCLNTSIVNEWNKPTD